LIFPVSAVRFPLKSFKSVVLPFPFLPITPMRSSGYTVKEKLLINGLSCSQEKDRSSIFNTCLPAKARLLKENSRFLSFWSLSFVLDFARVFILDCTMLARRAFARNFEIKTSISFVFFSSLSLVFSHTCSSWAICM